MASEAATAEWSGYPDPSDPDNFWIDDGTGERVNAYTGERTSRFAKPAINDATGHCVSCGRDNGGHDGDPCATDCPMYWEEMHIEQVQA